jgi:hypothetical protein
METNDSFVGHCMSEFTASAQFLVMAQNGNLMKVCQLIRERAKIAADLEQVEQQLRSCNHPTALSEFGQCSKTRRKTFETELIRLVDKLEVRKCERRARLQQIDERLAQECAGLEWRTTTTFASLIPETRAVDPAVTHRFIIIDKHLEKSDLDICRILDSTWRRGEAPAGFLPDNWTERYGVTTFVGAYSHPACRRLVGPMIAKRRGRDP